MCGISHIMVSLQVRKKLRLQWHGIPSTYVIFSSKGDGESDREHLGMNHSTELPVECFVPCSCLCICLFQHAARKCTAVFGQNCRVVAAAQQKGERKRNSTEHGRKKRWWTEMGICLKKDARTFCNYTAADSCVLRRCPYSLPCPATCALSDCDSCVFDMMQVAYDGTSPPGDVAGETGQQQGVGRWKLATAAGWLTLGVAW